MIDAIQNVIHNDDRSTTILQVAHEKRVFYGEDVKFRILEFDEAYNL